MGVRGGVEEVDAEEKGAADWAHGVVVGNWAEDVAEGGGAESDGAELQSRVAQWSEL